MSCLQFEAMGFDRVKAAPGRQYADHQTLQNDARHTDDHRFLETACRKFGAYYAKPGNGICHVVHLEQFARPGESLLGSDTHTPHWARSRCWRSAPAASTSRSPWAAGRTCCRGRRSCGSS